MFVERNVHNWSFFDMGTDPRTMYALSAKAVSDFPRGTLEICSGVNAVDTVDAVGVSMPVEAVLSQRSRHS